ncbi:Putative AAA+ ATPase domain, ATPase, AAA-type, core, AAA ATPase, AAA+ lid domain-containing protein [Septoria linicola]|uniref:AAA+ ATPase domain, ATPase, AAA-type, core, AAA ATPase, AAA+ lid domain-containing protein n=1 Tax=Septoria linicola TaxID=215465 RepID=A0A9Q9AHW4_9PEZI|nr:putative AAA+ ATPase domain, ATPase, AAA-type, core, AAA ATPase, AAA+ lid domain-containing protein [Septoria linicola]USW46690.1 Putative AAA+ ATPase domain, ATPase, AAA-type, core, AAA ATPase, AAA+ lid domain-containing protein [Septoria linicola]
MRCIARQSVRLASSSRVRAASQSRSRLPQHQQQSSSHLRSFGCSARGRLDNRGPHPPSDHHDDSLDSRPEEQRAREQQDADSITKEDGEAADRKVVGDGTRKPKLAGKTFRQRRKEAQAISVPKPPPIPDWFLQHNVKLFVDTVKPNKKAENAQVLRCVDKETGHTLFTLPYYEAWPVPGLKPESTIATDATQAKGKAQNAPKKSLHQNYFGHKFGAHEQSATSATKKGKNSIDIPPSDEPYKEVNPHALLRWATLQAETGVRAAFSVARNAPHASSQAASRLDLSLFCKDPDSHAQMDEYVEDLAMLSGANVIRLDANDLAELSSDYVGQGSDSPGSFSNLAYDVFGGYTSQTVSQAQRAEHEEDEAFDEDEIDEEEEDDEAQTPRGMGHMQPFNLDNLRKTLMNGRFEIGRAMSKIGASDIIVDMGPQFSKSASPFRPMGSRDEQDFDEARLTNLLEQVVDATKHDQAGSLQRRYNLHKSQISSTKDMTKTDASQQALWRMWRSSAGCWRPDVAGLLASQINGAAQVDGKDTPSLSIEPCNSEPAEEATINNSERTIIHVRDLRDVGTSRVGERIIRRLVSVVQKRRRAGQQIVIVGTSCTDPSGFVPLPQALEEFRTVSIPAVFHMSTQDQASFKPTEPANDNAAVPPYSRILEINLRHIQRMLRSLRPGESVDLFTESAQRQLRFGDDILGKKVMSFDMIQRIVLTAIGLSEVHAVSETINASHIGLATMITRQAAQTERDWSDHIRQKQLGAALHDTKGSNGTSESVRKEPSKLEKIRKSLNTYEQKLAPGVVDAENIKAGFAQVHAPAETIEALKTLTSLSLLRPDAFKYGVLAADRLPGLMLYGPPGTGKTLLAKAVAKESGATVLEISGAQIYEKYVGEGEKMVRAVFSLAKKLSPCIVFIDEADAIFGSRSTAGNRNTHREIINQFLREWDGMDGHDCFIMVASNRPFDLDDAVLRRLPRRLLVDLPVAKDRESILKIHLTDEALDNTVDLSKLATDTPLYSGSDLKNLCVSAALACVREENELAESAKQKADSSFKLPEKRTLSSRHFDKAVKEISASISEDMGSLTAIRKFDEQYGDRRNRRKKTAYGFGVGKDTDVVDEDAARVRKSDPSPSTSSGSSGGSASPGAPP